MKGLREMDAVISLGMIAFKGFRFDVGLRRLLRPDSMGVWAPVADWVARTGTSLASCCSNQVCLVTKDAIMRQVWPGIAVEANNLTVQIAALRKVLDGNRASESCIRTVSGRGYRFVAPVMRPCGRKRGRVSRAKCQTPKAAKRVGHDRREHGVRVSQKGMNVSVPGFIPIRSVIEPGSPHRHRSGWNTNERLLGCTVGPSAAS